MIKKQKKKDSESEVISIFASIHTDHYTDNDLKEISHTLNERNNSEKSDTYNSDPTGKRRGAK